MVQLFRMYLQIVIHEEFYKIKNKYSEMSFGLFKFELTH